MSLLLHFQLQQPITVYGQDLLLILFPVLSMMLMGYFLDKGKRYPLLISPCSLYTA